MSPGKTVTVSVLQPGYLPWLGYFDLAALSDTFVIYDDVAFDKRSWRNRNRILGPAGPQWLTVPVETKGRFGQPINTVRIADQFWPAKHLMSLRHCYGKAPSFDWLFPQLDAYLSARTYSWLLDLCLEGHDLLCRLLAVRSERRLSSELGIGRIGKTERLAAIATSLNARRFIATDASQAYMNEAIWRAAGVDLVYQRYPHPVYPQIGPGFVSHLSVVDALMFLGPQVRDLIGTPPVEARIPPDKASGQDSAES